MDKVRSRGIDYLVDTPRMHLRRAEKTIAQTTLNSDAGEQPGENSSARIRVLRLCGKP